MHSHGPFVWGPSGKKAVENAFALEIIAEMALKAIQLNPQVQPISSHLLDKHFLRKHGSQCLLRPKNLRIAIGSALSWRLVCRSLCYATIST